MPPIIDGGAGGAIFNNNATQGTQGFVLKGKVTTTFGPNLGQQVTLVSTPFTDSTTTVLGTYFNYGVVSMVPDSFSGRVPTLLTGPGAQFRNSFGSLLIGSGNLGTVSSPAGVVVSEGKIAPRDGARFGRGVINIVADTTRLVQWSVISIGLDATGTNAGRIDMLNITGAAVFDGIVELNIAPNSLIDEGDRWTFLTVTSYTGAFSGLNVIGAPPGLQFRLDYLTYGVDVVAVPEPATWLMWLAGAAGLLAWRRRQAAATACPA